MSRDYTKLRVFKTADELILEIYQAALRQVLISSMPAGNVSHDPSTRVRSLRAGN